MAWIHPVQNRANASTRTTASDMNRINGNVVYLWGEALKTDYTSNDIVTKTDWDNTIAYTNEIAELVGMDDATDSTRYDNLNYIESIAYAYWATLPLFPQDYLYPEDDIYPR